MIAIGGTKITKAYLGSTELVNIAIGDELLLSSEPIEYLEFEDPEFWRICCINYGDHDGSTPIGITASQCAAVTTLRTGYHVTCFSNNTSIVSANDLKYFTGLTVLAEYCFQGCTGLVSATIPANVETIDTYAFQGCTNLETVTLDAPLKITRIAGVAFHNCRKLAGFTIPTNVTSIGNQTFQNNYLMTSIDIQSGLSSIGTNTFGGCTGVTSISGFDHLTSIGQQGFASLGFTGHVDLNSIVTVSSSAFESAKMTSLHIGANCTTITGAAFFNIKSLQWVIIDATTPPTLTSTNGFGNASYPIYVPDAAYNDYIAANNWSSYGSRIKKISEKP